MSSFSDTLFNLILFFLWLEKRLEKYKISSIYACIYSYLLLHILVNLNWFI